MLKKSMPFLLIVGFVLGGCMNNDALPKNNETPMDAIEDRPRDDWSPNVKDENQSGSELDGIDNRNERDRNGNREGILNDDIIDYDTNGDTNQNDNTPEQDVREKNLDRRGTQENVR